MISEYIDFELAVAEARRERPYQFRAFRSAIEAAFGPMHSAVTLQDAFAAVRFSVEQVARQKIIAFDGVVDEPVPILGLDMQPEAGVLYY